MKINTGPKHLMMMVFLYYLVTYYPRVVKAQWSTDPAENNRITSVNKDQRDPSAISDGSGGVIIAWRDYRFTESIFGGEIFAQRLNASSVAQWDNNGKQINASALNKGHFRPLLTGSNGSDAIIVWERGPLNFYNYDIYAQKLDSTGNRLWSLNDVVISNMPGTKAFHKIVGDGAGGALITWTYLPGTPGTTDIYAQRVDSGGITMWKNNGVAVCTKAESQSNPNIVSDGHGGAIIAWDDSRDGVGMVNIFAQRVDSLGNILWQDGGMEINGFSSRQGISGIISDGMGGAILAWTYSGSEKGVYVQRIDENGAKQWGDNGVRLSQSFYDQFSCDIVADNKGGVIVVWQDERGQDGDIYAQRVNAEGKTMWVENGVPVSALAGDQASPVAMSDGNGGVITIWADYRNDAQGDLYAQRLNATGIPLWQKNGLAVSTAPGEQSFPVIAPDRNKGAIFVWADKRNGSDYDIYAQLVNKDGRLGEFIDTDNDGIQDKEEMGPQQTDQNYDGNGDKIADHNQGNVASFYTYDKQHYVTLAVPDSLALENVAAIDNPKPGAAGVPQGATAPYGFFSFSITGLSTGSHTVATLILDKEPVVTHYYKYGPTPGMAAHWYEFDYDGETGARISSDTVFLYLADGKRGDYDTEANGRIADPGGPLKIEIISSVPPDERELFLLESYPNPALNATNIVYAVPENMRTELLVFDLTGKVIKSLFRDQVNKGKHTLVWETSELKSGVYILKLTAGKMIITKKIVITR